MSSELTDAQADVLRDVYRQRLHVTGDRYWVERGDAPNRADVEHLIQEGLAHVDLALGFTAPAGPTFTVRISKTGKGALRDADERAAWRTSGRCAAVHPKAHEQQCTHTPHGPDLSHFAPVFDDGARNYWSD